MANEELQTPAAEFETAVSNLLSTYAPPVSQDLGSVDDTSSSQSSIVYPNDLIDKVAQLLKQVGKPRWSVRPRTYIVLRLINRLDNMDAFVVDGLLDIAFPYTYDRLPVSLSPGVRNAFLEKQAVVLSKAGDLEIESGQHRHFSSTEGSNFIVVKQLGNGYFGVVDHVRSKLSLEEYARKRTMRARTFSKDKKGLKTFENELSNLKRLSHYHLVKYVGSYTDPKYIGLLITPVADCDLRVFLTQSPFPHTLLSCLRSFLGCLCSAVSYLHSQRCRHKDIKPGNILVKANAVLITDFGTSRNWSDRSKGTTTGESGPFTPGYVAPEVVAWEARNESSDIWSLGCVYLDILTVLKGETLRSKDRFFGENGNGGKNPRVNPQALTQWLSHLKNVGDDDCQPIFWIQQMLQLGPKDRISSVRLLDDILGYADQHIYYGHCCAGHEEEESSCNSSEFEEEDDADVAAEESTNATTVSSAGRDPDAKVLKIEEKISPTFRAIVDDRTKVSPGPQTDPIVPFQNKTISQPSAPMYTASPANTPVGGPVSQPPPVAKNETSRTNPPPVGTILRPRNPFKPGHTSYSRPRSPSPQQTLFESSAEAQVPRDPFSTILDPNSTSHGNHNGISEVNDSKTQMYSPNVSGFEIPIDEVVPDTRGSGPYSQPLESGLSLAQPLPQIQSPSFVVNSVIEDADILYEAATLGDIDGVIDFCLAGDVLRVGDTGKQAFRGAASNRRIKTVQMLLDLGCPIYFRDVGSYIVPMVRNKMLSSAENPYLHHLVLQFEKFRQQGPQMDTMIAYSIVNGNLGDGDATEIQVWRTDNSDPLGVESDFVFETSTRQGYRRGYHQSGPVVGPWEPAAFHYGLTVSPDPDAMAKAIEKGDFPDVVKYLKLGYDVNRRNDDDQSPLDIAIINHHMHIARLLITYGANPTLSDQRGGNAYTTSQSNLFGAELRQVLEMFKEYDQGRFKRLKDPNLPKIVDIPWALFLKKHVLAEAFPNQRAYAPWLPS